MKLLETLLLLALFCGVTTLIVQKFVASKTVVTIVSAILGAVFLQIGDLVNLGFLDPFYQIAFVISLLPALVICFCTTLLIRKLLNR
jgi:hypothetical protein